MIYLNPPTGPTPPAAPRPPLPPLPPMPAAAGSPTLAIVSLTSAVIGIGLAAALLGPLAVITGAVGCAPGRPMRGLALAGLLVGIVVTLAGIYNMSHAAAMVYSPYGY